MPDPLFDLAEPAPAPAAGGAPSTDVNGQGPNGLEITVHPHERPNEPTDRPLFGLDENPSKPIASGKELKPLENAPSDQGQENWGKLGATAGLTGMSTLAGGMAGDTVEAARNIAAGLVSTTGPRSTQNILDEWNAARDKENDAAIKRLQEAQKPEWLHVSDDAWEKQKAKRVAALRLNHGAPPTTQNVYQGTVAPKLGAYTPTTTPGEFANSAIAGAVPGAIAGPLGVAAGVLGGVTSEGMQKSGANPFWSTAVPLGAGAVVPSVGKGATAVRKGVAGMSEAEKQATAARLFHDQLSDPKLALQRAQERAGEPDETFAESTVRGNTGDQGAARTQDALLTAGQPEMVKANQANQAGRIGAMSDTLSRISPDSAPGDVSAAVQHHLDHINAAADAAPQPVGSHAEVAGGNLAEAGQTQHDTHMEAYKALKKSVDPTGRMQAWAGDLNEAAATKLKESENRQYKTELGPVATKYLTMAAKMKDVMSLNDLIDFDQNITQGLKQTHDTVPADYGVLSELKGQVKKAMNEALENQHKAEQVKVQDGTLNPEDTVASRFERERDDWLARKKAAAGNNGAAGAGTADAGTAGSVPPVHGVGPEDGSSASASAGTGSGVGGPGDAGGAAGVSGGAAPFEPVTPEAARRLALSNAYYGKIKDTYGKGVVGKALDTEFGGQSKMLNADVAQKAFVPGTKGRETAQMWIAAGGPEGLAALKDIATGRLQSELKGKPLDQKSLDAWKNEHADALRTIDEEHAKANPGQNSKWSDKFDDAAEARSTVQEFEDNSAAKFLGMQPGDVVNHVAELLKSKNSEPLRDLMKQVDGMPNADAIKPALQRAGAQWLQDNFEQAGIKNIRNLIDNKRDALEALFDKDAVAQMDKVKESIDKSATVQALANRDTPGSQTMPREKAIERLEAQLKASTGKDQAHNALNGANALLVLELMQHVWHSIGAGDFKAAVGGTLGLGATMFVKPMLENALAKRGLKTQVKITKVLAEGFAHRDVGAALLKQVIDENGRPNQMAIDTLADALVGAETSTQQKREERASGGAVFDHKAAAKHMSGLVDKVRKRDADRTKPLLQAHDTTIANALALANRSI